MPRNKRYFVNDVICRVKTIRDCGSIVDIGVVEYPSTSSSSKSPYCNGNVVRKSQTHQDLVHKIREGFCGNFFVTWSHNSHNPIVKGSGGIREWVSAEDESIFLLDRQLIPGMFVRKLSDDSIGIVKAVDVQISATIPPGSQQVVTDIAAKSLEWDWQTESVLGGHFMTNGWIGQVVEVKRSAQLAMELNSQFEIFWEEKLSDDEVKRVLGNEIHHRFNSVGDILMLSMLELTRVKWITKPEGKGLFWPVVRPYEYSNRFATVEHIFTDLIRFKWIEKLLSTAKDTDSDPPKEWVSAQELGHYLSQKQLQSLKLPVPETKRIGDFICLFNKPTTVVDVQSYARWANTYLHEMKIRNTLPETKENGPPEKKQRTDRLSNAHFYDGSLETFHHIDFENRLLSGRIIARKSRVAVEWSPTSIESLHSTDIAPVFLDRSLGYQPGTIVSLNKTSVLIHREEAEYGVVVRSYNESKYCEQFVTVNMFKILLDSNVPVLDAVIEVEIANITEHPLYNYRPGSILIRSNPYDEFTAGVFLGASETGELITACPNGKIRNVWPNRVIQLIKKAELNRKKKKTESDWKVGKGYCRHNGLNEPMELTNLNPPSTSFAFQVFDEFVDKNISIWVGSVETHFAISSELSYKLANGRLTEQFLYQELRAAEILPEGIWIKNAKYNQNLYYVAIDGPIGTVYEDSVLFFEMGLPQNWTTFRGDAHIFFASYYLEQIIPDLNLDGNVRFGVTGTINPTGYQKPEIRLPRPSLAAILLTLRESSLRADPIHPLRGRFETLPFASMESEKRDINANALIQVTVSIINQLLNPPLVWQEELKSYYMVHVPKFCARITRWVTGLSTLQESPKFSLLPIDTVAKKEELLNHVRKLMEIYGQMF